MVKQRESLTTFNNADHSCKLQFNLVYLRCTSLPLLYNKIVVGKQQAGKLLNMGSRNSEWTGNYFIMQESHYYAAILLRDSLVVNRKPRPDAVGRMGNENCHHINWLFFYYQTSHKKVEMSCNSRWSWNSKCSA